MKLFLVAVFLFLIIIPMSQAFADSSNMSWKITIKTNPGVNNTSFWPPEMHVRQNETVEWTNNDTTTHTVTSGVMQHPTYWGKTFDSGIINPGNTYSLKIPAHVWNAYYYFCKIHPWMIGKIDVGSAYLGISPDFSIETDNERYSNGDTIRISGIITNTDQITPITIQIFDSNRNLVFLDKTNLFQDHSFFYELKASSFIFKTTGDYKIKSFYGFPSTITDVNISYNDVPTSSSIYNIPHWMKNNAKWWSDGEISDSDFINGIQFLMKNGYVVIQTPGISKINSNGVPIWIKNNAREWGSDNITDQEFASCISYLVSHKIIQS